MKQIAVLLILFFTIAFSVSSLKTFEVEETEKISLAPKAEDPDADQLIYSFTEPLDENGEWQTDYGDAGEYESIVTVSDGENDISEAVKLIVNKKDEKPTIGDFTPKEEFIIIDEGTSLNFEVIASDLNGDELDYKWVVNDKIFTNGKTNVEIQFAKISRCFRADSCANGKTGRSLSRTVIIAI